MYSKNFIGLNLFHVPDCSNYYRKYGENTLYKYMTNGNVAIGNEVHKSASSNSSTCDSCSHISNLSTVDESSRQNYFLNLAGTKCGLYHSSFSLNCHEPHSSHTSSQRRPDSICNANSQCKCHCPANTISRLSNVKFDSVQCVAQECFDVHHNIHLASLSSPLDTLKLSSPSTTSLAHCLISCDQESLFSQSSQGSSSNSSSGCSSLACVDHNHQTSNQHFCLQQEEPRLTQTKHNQVIVERTNHERNVPNSECPYEQGFIDAIQCEVGCTMTCSTIIQTNAFM